MSENSYVKKNLITIGLLLLTLIIVFLFISAYQVFLLIFMSILFALLIDGLAGLITKYAKVKKPYSTIISLILILLTIVLLAWLVGPPIIEQIIVLIDNLPAAFEKLRGWIMQTSWGAQLFAKMPDTEKLVPLGSEALTHLTAVFSSTFNFFSNAIIILILSIYLAFDPKLYIDNLALLFPAAKRDKYHSLFNAWEFSLKWWLLGRLVSMLVVGLLTLIGLWIIGMNLALSLSVIAALLSFVPFIGPILAIVPAVLLGFTQSPTMALYVLIVYIAVQQIESYLITPFIEQKVVSLPPVLVISAQILMAAIFGFFGILLASPIIVLVIVAIQILYVKGVLGENVKILGK